MGLHHSSLLIRKSAIVSDSLSFWICFQVLLITAISYCSSTICSSMTYYSPFLILTTAAIESMDYYSIATVTELIYCSAITTIPVYY